MMVALYMHLLITRNEYRITVIRFDMMDLEIVKSYRFA